MLLNNTLDAFGLDIGDESVKIVKLEKKPTFRGKSRLFLDFYGEVKVPGGVVKNGEIKNPEKLAAQISTLLKNKKNKSRAVVVSLPEKKSFLKLLEIKAKNQKNLEVGLPKIIEKHFPLPYKEIYTDWQIMSKKEESGDFKYSILVAAAPIKTINSITKILESLKLIPLAIEMEGVAIARSVSRPEEMSQNLDQAIVDIGATCSSLVFIKNNVPTLSLSLPVSGNEMTKTIANSLNLSLGEAEKIKIECGLDLKLCKKQLRPVLSLIIADTAEKIKKGLKFYETTPSKKISSILLSGGGSNLLKLDSVLSQKLKVRVKKCNPAVNIETKDEKFKMEAIKYTTAIGLAIRGIISPGP